MLRAVSPLLYRMIEITSVSSSCTTSSPMPPAARASHLAASSAYGVMRAASSPLPASAIVVHAEAISSPISGMSCTQAGGDGIGDVASVLPQREIVSE